MPNPGASIVIKIKKFIDRELFTTYASSPVLLLATLDNIVCKCNCGEKIILMKASNPGNPYATPVFNPTEVNQYSTMKIGYTIGSNRDLVSGTSGLILAFTPAIINGMYNLLPSSGLRCYIGLVYEQKCYSYPEVGWIAYINMNKVRKFIKI